MMQSKSVVLCHFSSWLMLAFHLCNDLSLQKSLAIACETIPIWYVSTSNITGNVVLFIPFIISLGGQLSLQTDINHGYVCA